MKTNETETELLCLLGRSEPGKDALARARVLLQGPLDWDRLVRTSSLHRVLPRVYRNLRSAALPGAPSSVLSRLREAFLGNAARNLRLSVRLKEVCGLLEERGIEAVPFKGPVLAQALYGDVTFRQFADLDVLVPRDAAQEAVSTFEAQGFVPEIFLTASQFRRYARRNKGLHLVHPAEGVPLDLHWDLSGDYARGAMDLEAFRGGLQEVELLDAPLATLGHEDLVLYLCLHATMESWSWLDHVCCVGELIRKNPHILSSGLYEKARELRVRRCLLVGCALAGGLLDVPVPRYLSERIERDGRVKAYVAACVGRLFPEGDGVGLANIKSKFSNIHLQIKDSLAGQVRHLLFLLFSPTVEDWRRLPLPGSLGFLLCGYRPFRLGMDYVRGRSPSSGTCG